MLRAARAARTGVMVAGALVVMTSCAGGGASVTRAAAPSISPPADPAATTAAPASTAPPDPAATPTTAAAAAAPSNPATTAPAVAAPVASMATVAAAPAPAAPAPAAPAADAAPVQKGPVLEGAPPPAAALGPVSSKSSKADVSALQQRLLDLGFWVPDTDGSYGWVTQQAVMAFQKYYGLNGSGNADQTTVDLMNLTPYRVLAQGWDHDMIEVDKGKQLLFIVQGGKTIWALNTSTGSGAKYVEPSQKEPGELVSGTADTPEGIFKVYSQQPNGWWQGDLGQLYRPKFFKGGSAVHGAPKVPNYPASHGCVRVTPEAMDFIWAQNYLPQGGEVWVHA